MKTDAKPVVLAKLRRGLYRKDAATAAGISYECLRSWMRKDPAFDAAVKAAEQASIERLVERIETAAEDPRHWTAAAWLLERRHAKKYAKRDRLDVKAIPADKLSDAELRAELETELGKLKAKTESGRISEETIGNTVIDAETLLGKAKTESK